ncbi:MAG: GGDEF domain-containing protein [Gammaproteobacteria bacterium]|nr:GGDEF domain-containing protein [Gammaproteobacteria bacterium]
MRQTDQTLFEQLRMTDLEIEYRKDLFSIRRQDQELLNAASPLVEARIGELIERFYKEQTSIPEVALLIGDADTLGRLKSTQQRYVFDLFNGPYDHDYVKNRLRIGLVHKRIGVEPKLFLAGICRLRGLLQELLSEEISGPDTLQQTLAAMEKLFLFDVNLVFDTYIRSLVSEVEAEKNKLDQYAKVLEEKVRERTRQLEELARIDPLTGLLNIRYLNEVLTRTLRRAARRGEPVSLVFMDVDSFKSINDTRGHLYGDEVLRVVGDAIGKISRAEDSCFRYGGDEFCVILPNCRAEQARDTYCMRLRKEVSDQLENVTLSIGIVETGPDDYQEPSQLIHTADARMYQEKRASKLPPRERC